jgi:excisionase family DNA binding protein
MEKLLLRVPEAAAIASVGRTTAYQLIASGAWPVVRIGTAVRVHAAGLQAWVDAQKTGGLPGTDSTPAATTTKRNGAEQP